MRRPPRMPRPIWYPTVVLTVLVTVVIVSFVTRAWWALAAQMPLVFLGVRQTYLVMYWIKRQDVLLSWRALTGIALEMDLNSHYHAADNTCYTTSFGITRGRIWHVVRVLPGSDNHRVADVVHGVIRTYLFSARDPIVTLHNVPFTAWPGGEFEGWSRTTVRDLVGYRRQGFGLELTPAEVDELTEVLAGLKPRP